MPDKVSLQPFLGSNEPQPVDDHGYDVPHAFAQWCIEHGIVYGRATVEQRCDFLAFIAHEIGYDLLSDLSVIHWRDGSELQDAAGRLQRRLSDARGGAGEHG